MSNFSPVNLEYTLPTFLESSAPVLVQYSLSKTNSNPSSRRGSEIESDTQLARSELTERGESESDSCLTKTSSTIRQVSDLTSRQESENTSYFNKSDSTTRQANLSILSTKPEIESYLTANGLTTEKVSKMVSYLTKSDLSTKSESSLMRSDFSQNRFSDINVEPDQRMKQVIQDIVNERLDRLYGLWTELGLNHENKVERNKTIQTYFVDLLDRMVEEEYRSKKKILDSLEANTRKAVKLSVELGIPFEEPDHSLVLIHYEKAVRIEATKLMGIKEERMKEVIALKREDEELSKKLCADPFYISTSTVPTTEKLEALKEHIAALENEKFTRLEKFFKLKEAILALYDDLESEPVTEFEREVVCEDADKFVLSSSNLSEVANILSKLEARFKTNQKIVMDAVEKLDSLYERLQLDMNEKFQFLDEHRGNAPTNIRKLHLEIARLEEIKKANIGKFINTLRDELHSIWDECFYTQEQRNAFKPLHSIEFTEELLEQHEEEVKRLKKYINLNRNLLTKVGQRQEVWRKYMELERRAKDPSRLMNARGNQLLLEEKERNKVNKLLPMLEHELKDLIADWEDQNQTEFLVGGVCFALFCDQQKADHIMQIEAEKQAREQSKKKMLHQESMFGVKSASKFSINSTGTPKQPPRTPLSKHRTPASKTPMSTYSRARLAGSSVASPVRSVRSPHAGVKGGRIMKGKSPAPGSKRTPKRTPAKQQAMEQALRGILEDCTNERIIKTRAALDMSVASEVPDYADFKKGTPLNSTVKGTPEPSRASRFATPKVPASKGNGFSTPKSSSTRLNKRY